MERLRQGLVLAQAPIPFVQEVIEPGFQVHADGSAAYRSLSE